MLLYFISHQNREKAINKISAMGLSLTPPPPPPPPPPPLLKIDIPIIQININEEKGNQFTLMVENSNYSISKPKDAIKLEVL